MVISMKERIGRIFYQKGTNAALIYVSADIVKDSAFPLKVPSRVNVKIDGKRLIVEEAKE